MRQVFVISDLHLGGRPPQQALQNDAALPCFQFNSSYPALIEFIDWVGRVAQAEPASETELVINGDFVDFLAEDDYPGGGRARVWIADEREAAGRLEQIARRTWGQKRRGVFEALRDFAAAGNRLTLLLGNHDVELSMPRVRRRLFELLGGADRPVRFLYDGESYTAGRVLIEHGNRYDRWNMLDYNGLRQERSMRSRHLEVREEQREQRYFIPPAGTHLVVHVFNKIKERYRFLDQIKPETGTVLPLLLALEPGLWRYLRGFVPARMAIPQAIRSGMASPGLPQQTRNMGREGETSGPTLSDVLTETLGREDAAFFIDQFEATGVRRSAGQATNMGRTGTSAGKESDDGLLQAGFDECAGSPESLSELVRPGPQRIPEIRRRLLHIALKRVHERDGSFNLEMEDAPYLEAARESVSSGEIDVVVYGHTHLPKYKRIDHKRRRCWYLNTGTWCDVMRLPDEIVQDYATARDAIRQFLTALQDNDFDRYVQRYLSYVELKIDPKDGALAAPPHLYSFCGTGRERSDALTSYSP